MVPGGVAELYSQIDRGQIVNSIGQVTAVVGGGGGGMGGMQEKTGGVGPVGPWVGGFPETLGGAPGGVGGGFGVCF